MFKNNVSRIVPYRSDAPPLFKAIGAVPTTAFAAISPLEVIQLGKDLISFLAVVKIFGFQFIIVKLHRRFCFNISQLYGSDHPLHLSFHIQCPGRLALHHIERAGASFGLHTDSPRTNSPEAADRIAMGFLLHHLSDGIPCKNNHLQAT
jgi:hypothetical protein